MLQTIILETQPLVKPDMGLVIWSVISLGILALLIIFLFKLYKYIARK